MAAGGVMWEDPIADRHLSDDGAQTRNTYMNKGVFDVSPDEEYSA